jgi:hypothetical protein
MKEGFDVGGERVELAQFHVQIEDLGIVGVKHPRFTTREFAIIIVIIIIIIIIISSSSSRCNY